MCNKLIWIYYRSSVPATNVGYCSVKSLLQNDFHPHCTDTSIQTSGSHPGLSVNKEHAHTSYFQENAKGQAEEGQQYQFLTVNDVVKTSNIFRR